MKESALHTRVSHHHFMKGVESINENVTSFVNSMKKMKYDKKSFLNGIDRDALKKYLVNF